MGWDWVVLPAVGSVIGWLTNFLAIRMLFRPKAPKRVWGLFTIQGVLPRRQDALARVVAETVERDLLPLDELVETLDVSGYQTDVVDAVIRYVDRRLEENLPDVLPAQVRRMVTAYVRRMVAKEAADVVADVSERVERRVREDIHLGALIRDKVNALDTDELEKIVVRVAGTELRVIEGLGAVLGLIIGAFQAALLSWL